MAGVKISSRVSSPKRLDIYTIYKFLNCLDEGGKRFCQISVLFCVSSPVCWYKLLSMTSPPDLHPTTTLVDQFQSYDNGTESLTDSSVDE